MKDPSQQKKKTESEVTAGIIITIIQYIYCLNVSRTS